MWSLFTIFVCFTCLGDVFGLESALDKESRDRMVSTLNSKQSKKTGLFGDFYQTFNAIRSYQRMSTPVPETSTLCKTLPGLVKSAKNLESLTLVYMSIADLDCKGIELPSDVTEKIQSGLKSTKVSNLYHSTKAVHALVSAWMESADKFDMSSVLGQLEAAKGDVFFKESPKDSGEGSPYKTAMAIQIAADLYENAPSEKEAALEFLKKDGVSAVGAILKRAKKFAEMMFWQDSLTATTAVLESLIRIKNILGDEILIPVLVYEPLGKYFLLNKNSKSIGAIANVLLGTSLLRDHAEVKPRYYSYATPFCLIGADSHLLTVQVTDIWGEPVKGCNVTLQEPFQNEFVESDGLYTLDIGEQLKSHSTTPDIIKTSITINSEGRDPITLESSLIHGVELSKGNLKISNFKGASEKKESKVSYPDSTGKTYRANGKFKVSMGYKFPNLGITPEQIYVILTDPAGVEKSVSAPGKPKGSKYTNTIDSKKEPYNKLENGVYDISIILGDEMLKNSISWKVAAVNITKPKVVRGRKGDYEPVNDETVRFYNQEPIEHTFAEPERRPPRIISLFFAGLTFLPFGGLVWGVFNVLELQVTLPTGQAKLVAVLFQVSLIGVAFFITSFWVKVGIFQSLALILVTSVIASILGYKTLKYRLLEHS